MPSAGEAEGASGRCKRPLARLTLSKAPKPLAEELWRTGRRGAHIRKRNTARRAPLRLRRRSQSPARAKTRRPGPGRDPHGPAMAWKDRRINFDKSAAAISLLIHLHLHNYFKYFRQSLEPEALGLVHVKDEKL